MDLIDLTRNTLAGFLGGSLGEPSRGGTVLLIAVLFGVVAAAALGAGRRPPASC